MKKKSFTFQEEDLDWINPLLVEWAKENEGKTQSDLVLQLLKDHRDRGPTLKETLDGATSSVKERVSEYSARSKEALDGFKDKSKEGLQSVQSKVQAGGGGFMDRLRKAEADVRNRLEEVKPERSKPKEDPEEE